MTKKTTTPPLPGFATGFGAFTTPQPFEGWATFFAPQARMAEAMLKQNIEMLDFLKARFERDRAMLEDLANATDPADATALWQDFWQRMLTDYSVETNKLAASATEIAEQALRTATEEGEALMAKGKKK